MNLIDRNAELDKARGIKAKIAQAETRLDARDGEEGALKDQLQEAEQEFQDLIKKGERHPRVMVLNNEIHDLQEKLRDIPREPLMLHNTLRRLGSDFEGYRARDWQWLKNWRIGREKGMGEAINVEDEIECAMWLNEVRVHAGTFLNDHEAGSYITESEGKLARRRSELTAGRARNAEADAYVARLRADLMAEKAQRAEETRERLEKSDRQRADYRAQLDREMAVAKVEASLAFDRRVAKKEVRRHAWLVKYWTKIAKARDDKDFRREWLEKVFGEKSRARPPACRGSSGLPVIRPRHFACAEQFDLIRQRWERVVELLAADPTLTMDEAEDVADPEYREQRAEIKEREAEFLAVHNEAQKLMAKEQIGDVYGQA